MKTQICPTCGNGKVPLGFKITAPVVTATKAPRRLVGERTEHGVLVPSYQATGSGVISGLIGTVGSSLFWPTLECVKIGALVGLTTGALVWALALWDDRARVWYELERRFGVDLDGDGFVGKPDQLKAQEAPAVWIKDNEHQAHWRRHNIPFADLKEAKRIARASLAREAKFTRRALEKVGAIPDDPEHYSGIYQAMTKAGLLNKGGLTNKGREYLGEIIATHPGK